MRTSKSFKRHAVAAILAATVLAFCWCGAAFAGDKTPPCTGYNKVVGKTPKGDDLTAIRRVIHHVARMEGVDPFALEAIAWTETRLRHYSLGRHCELGMFQVSWWYYKVFKLPRAESLWDWRVNAIAAARIYKRGFDAWQPRFAKGGASAKLRKAGWTEARLPREVFAAIHYNWGRAARNFREADNLRYVRIPGSTCRYAVHYYRNLKKARRLGKTW